MRDSPSTTVAHRAPVAVLWLRRIPYMLFAVLFVFEFLNYIGVLHFRVDFTWLGRMVSSLGVFLILVVLDWMFEKKIEARMPGVILICGTVLLLIDFWGDIFGLYTRWPWYDQLAHFLSGPLIVVAFLVFYEALTYRLRWGHPMVLTYFFAWQTTVVLAVCYEIEEYSEDLLFLTNRLGDARDTANDLALNALGAALTLLCIAVFRRLRHASISERRA